MSDNHAHASARDEQHEIEQVIARLSERFPTVERARIESIVGEEAQQLDGSRVRDFVPVLVEHASRDRLRLEARPAPLDVAAQEARPVRADDAQHLDPMEIEQRSRATGLLLGDIDS